MKNILLSFLVSGLLMACGGGTTNGQYGADSPTPVVVNDTLLSNYLALKDALVVSDQAKANTAAESLVSVGADSLLVSLAKQIVAAETLSDQRVIFEAVTAYVKAYVDGNEAIELPVYVQYCPMAFDGRGASWLAMEEEIYNPYYGKMMLHCGVVKETIK